MSCRRGKRRGITLVEVLVSVVILGLGLVGASQLYLASMWTYQKARNLSIATERAQLENENLQRIAAESYETLVAAGTPLIPSCYVSTAYTALPTGRGVRFTLPDLPKGQGTITLTQNPLGIEGAAGAALTRADIAITWEGLRRGRSQVRVVTYLSRHEGVAP